MGKRNKRYIKFRYEELPKLLNQMVIIGKDGYLRLSKRKEKPRYAFGLLGEAFALFNIKTGVIIL